MKKILLTIFVATFVLLAPSALATHCSGVGAPNFGHDPITGNTFPCSVSTPGNFFTTVQTVFNIVFGILVIVASFMLLYAAFEYITAKGDEEKLGNAKNMIVYAIVAVVVAIFAWGLPRVVIGFFGGGQSNVGTCPAGFHPVGNGCQPN